MEDFKWTDELVKQYAEVYRFSSSRTSIEQFKEDHQPKKEYEILSYTFQKRVYNKNNFGEFCCGFDAPVQSLLLHPEDMKTIHSVKRLSDNEIFTVGDRVQFYNNSVIESFKVSGNTMVCDLSYTEQYMDGFSSLGNAYNVSINLLSKFKQLLFTTEDGVSISDENQTLYAVLTKAQWETREDTVKRMKERSSFSTPLNPAWKYFSTDEVRLHYIIRNKPSLSWNDVFNLFKDNGSSTQKFLDAVFEKSKSKITNP
jgi:hypothetical protein